MILNIMGTKTFGIGFIICIIAAPFYALWWEIFRRNTQKVKVKKNVPY